MALIKCRECGKEMSDQAKFCPSCGIENSILICPECGNQLSSKATTCPKCGYEFSKVIQQSENGNNFGMAIAAFVCSFFTIANIVGLILGIIAYNSNKNQNNKAHGFSLAAIIISSVSIGLFIILIITSIIGASSYYYWY